MFYRVPSAPAMITLWFAILTKESPQDLGDLKVNIGTFWCVLVQLAEFLLGTQPSGNSRDKS